MKAKPLETEEQRAEFRRKLEERYRIIWVSGGILILVASVWGGIYFQPDIYPASWIVGIILGTFMIVFEYVFRVITRRRERRSNLRLPPSGGWDSFAGFIVLSGLWFVQGFLSTLVFQKLGSIDSSLFLSGVFFLTFGFIFLLDAFLYALPQANRSISLHFAVPNDMNVRAYPIHCWRDENFDQIIKRLLNMRSFKRLLAKLHLPIDASMKFLYHEKYLEPKSTPNHEGMGARSTIIVIIASEEILGEK